jgi:hypothetical protein
MEHYPGGHRRLADARALIEHSYRRLSRLDELVARLLGLDHDLADDLAKVRHGAIMLALESVDRHLQGR